MSTGLTGWLDECSWQSSWLIPPPLATPIRNFMNPEINSLICQLCLMGHNTALKQQNGSTHIWYELSKSGSVDRSKYLFNSLLSLFSEHSCFLNCSTVQSSWLHILKDFKFPSSAMRMMPINSQNLTLPLSTAPSSSTHCRPVSALCLRLCKLLPLEPAPIPKCCSGSHSIP